MLWPALPRRALAALAETGAGSTARGDHWSVWIDWYDDVLAGVLYAMAGEAEDAAFTDIPGKLPWDDAKAVNREIARRLSDLHGEKLSEIPDQSPAPVRSKSVMEKSRRRLIVIALHVTERDFRAWRDPVVDHLDQLTASDFATGTNHSRIRDRLTSLGKLLPGDIADVKDRQFRIGYEIERFDGLMAAYRSGGEDMPALNAAQLEDLDRLRVALKMGIDKLERWSEFASRRTKVPRTKPMRIGRPSAMRWTKWPLLWNSTRNTLIRNCPPRFVSSRKPCAIREARPRPSFMGRSKARKISSAFLGNGR